MEMKRIKAPDIRTALRIAREQLGPDAMIMSNRRVADGVEIVASTEVAIAVARAEEVGSKVERTSAVRSGESLEELLAKRTTQPAGPAVAAAPELPTANALAAMMSRPAESSVDKRQFDELTEQLREMRAILESRLREGKGSYRGPADGVGEQLWQALGGSGLPEELVNRMLARLHPRDRLDDAWPKVVDGLTAEFSEAGDLVSDGGRFALVGPTGAGKSTTLCKLAVRWALEHGSDSLAIISLDTHRVGGSDMPRSIARLLECEFQAPRDLQALDGILSNLDSKRLVLIDTAGLTGREGASHTWLRRIGEESSRIESLMVLPATANAPCLVSAVEQYQAVQPVACVISKLDEAPCLGEVLGVVCRERLAVAYSTHGPDIPDDLRVASARDLVRAALEPVCVSTEPGPRPDRPGLGARQAAGGVERTTPFDQSGPKGARIA